jgi:hypothetical protein
MAICPEGRPDAVMVPVRVSQPHSVPGKGRLRGKQGASREGGGGSGLLESCEPI